MINHPTVRRLRAAATRPGAGPDAAPPSRPTRRGQAFDLALALLLAFVCGRYATLADTLDTSAPHGLLPLVPLVPLPLALRRRHPLAVLWTVLPAALLVRHLSQDIAYGAGVAVVVAAYSAAAYGRRPRAVLLSLPAATAALVLLFTEAKLPHFPNGVIAVLVLVPVFAVAYELRMWRRRVDEGRERLSALEREQLAALDRAVELERARIARELHDVVTHNVSMMTIQAGAARKILDTAPDKAREAMAAVESGGRAAMTELRHVMGLLTIDSESGEDPAGGADLSPQPGLGRLDALVEGVRRAGLPVELSVRGERRAVPPGVELAAYRVVQEALTNTVKHAGGADAAVTVEYAPDHLRVDVTDTGGRPTGAAATGDGRGLLGLRERLAVYGGTLQTGPRPRGGYRVTALIPLESS
ncbi:sensor histidine kinase [Streptomyces sp. 1331.2]|uniref:sensor histidine kinase n=1 Tax=Streptomyces sp. 1331.2 TaxID=1938835 RepID=UPI000BC58A57|nr:sensor histidine kinase [Streptomyces sp. 1331.2]SOB85365.1 Signal transduction histidine kinase [Streptomyces sp. 1331.2]